jgi:hypothetical protein
MGDDVSIDNETILVKKSVQSFGCAHRDMMCLYVFIGVIAHTCMSIYIMFLKKSSCS